VTKGAKVGRMRTLTLNLTITFCFDNKNTNNYHSVLSPLDAKATEDNQNRTPEVF